MHWFTPPGLAVSLRHQGTVVELMAFRKISCFAQQTTTLILFFENDTLFVILWKLLFKVLELRIKFEGEMLVEHVEMSC